MRYRKKLLIIEAKQFNGTNQNELMEWAHKGLPAIANSILRRDSYPTLLRVRTLEGEVIASPGDWIIKGIEGEFYPCRPDIFEATYEPVNEELLN